MAEAPPLREGGGPIPPAPEGGGPRAVTGRERAALAMGGVLLAAGYALTFRWTSDGFIATDGGLAYADQVAKAQWNYLLHPHHLLYHAAGYALSRLFLPVMDPWAASVLALRLMSAAGGAAAAALCYLLVRRVTGERYGAAAAGLMLAAATGPWHFASVMESHAPAMAASLGVLLALARAAQRPTPAAYAWVGAAHALAVVIRQDTVLLAPLIFCFALCWGPRGRGWPQGAAYAAALAAPAAAAYLIVYAVGVRGRPGSPSLGYWVTMYAHWGQWGTRSQVTWSSFLTTLRGTLAAVNVNLTSPLLVPGALALAAAALAAARRLPVWGRLLAALCAAWFALRLAFFTWWDPEDAFVYGATTALPLLVLAGLAAGGAGWVRPGPRRTLVRIGLAALVAAGAWTNLTGFVLPMRREGNFAAARCWQQVAHPQDLILSNDSSLVMALRYMTRLDGVYLPMLMQEAWGRHTAGQVRELIRGRAAAGARVYLTAEVLEGKTVVYDYSAWDRASGFERTYPAEGEVGRAVRDGFQWRPVALAGEGCGRAAGYVMAQPDRPGGEAHGG